MTLTSTLPVQPKVNSPDMPIIGPSSWLMWGTLAAQLRREPKITWELTALAEAHGLQRGAGQHGMVRRDRVQVADEAQHAGVPILVGQPPVETALVAPLLWVGELAAHEQERTTGVRPHPGVQRPEVGEARLVVLARHLAEQGALAVDDLVVRKREHEVL